jgi:hypothetical protein
MEEINYLHQNMIGKLDDIILRLKSPLINNQQGLPKYYSDIAIEFEHLKYDIDSSLDSLQEIANEMSTRWSANLGYNGGSLKRKKRKTRRN